MRGGPLDDYAARNPDWHAGDAKPKAAGLVALLRDHGVHPGTILDVGCGSGGVLTEVRAALGRDGPLPDCVGIDPSPEAIARCIPTTGLRFEVGDGASTAHRADLVLCVDVFEHLDDDLGFLRAIRPLAPRHAFRIPLDESLWDRARGRVRRHREQYGHLHAYTRRTALELLVRAGYAIDGDRYHRIPAGGPIGRAVRRAAFRVWPHRAVRVLGGWSLLVLATSDAGRGDQ